MVAAACGGDENTAASSEADADPAAATGAPAEVDTANEESVEDAANEQAPDEDVPTETVTTTAATEPGVYPGESWEVVDPGDAGLSADGVDSFVDFAESVDSGCLAVIRGGQLAIEYYGPDWDISTDLEVFSATKSVSATLVGIASDLGFLDIEEPASNYLEEWVGTDSESVTIRNLLANDSGRYWDFETDYTGLVFDADRSAFAIGLDQQHEPGTYWEYNNSAIQTLEEVLQRATGQEVADFAEANLFGPLGMDVHYALDSEGNTPTFMGLQAGCADMARFGWMARNNGEWAGEQVVSSDYMIEATQPSQELNNGYGFLWWVNEFGGWEDAPTDAYAALGLGDQVTLVIPSLDMVVVRIGAVSGSADYDGFFVNDLAAIAVAASS